MGSIPTPGALEEYTNIDCKSYFVYSSLMFYVIYQTTNKINGKIYIGKHKTANLDDGYLGSGRYLQRAITKYGVDNFTCEVLHLLNSEEEMDAKEREIVNAEFLKRDNVYNLKLGGEGGFDFINARGLGISTAQKLAAKQSIMRARANVTAESHKAKAATYKANYAAGKFENPRGFQGKHHTEEFKNRHSEFMSANQSGSKNSQFGSIWITDGDMAIKIASTTSIPDGWRRGRK